MIVSNAASKLCLGAILSARVFELTEDISQEVVVVADPAMHALDCELDSAVALSNDRSNAGDGRHVPSARFHFGRSRRPEPKPAIGVPVEPRAIEVDDVSSLRH
jgi:hypothetical protein